MSVFALAGCGGGSKNSVTTEGLLSGNWQMVLQKNTTVSRLPSGFLLQVGNNLSGGVLLSSNCTGVGSAQGQVNGSKVSLNITLATQTVSLTGDAVADGSSMSGDYSLLAAGCGTSEVGTWTATKIKSLNGNFQGTFISNATAGLAYDVALKITQGPNTGASNASLSGTITSAKAPCFSSLSVSGLVSGTAAVFNLVASDGSAVGQYRTVVSSDGTTLTGTYEINGQPGGCSLDTGAAILQLSSTM